MSARRCCRPAAQTSAAAPTAAAPRHLRPAPAPEPTLRPHAPARRLRLGDPLAALPLLHYALLKYSRHVCAKTVECGVQVGSPRAPAAARHLRTSVRKHAHSCMRCERRHFGLNPYQHTHTHTHTICTPRPAYRCIAAAARQDRPAVCGARVPAGEGPPGRQDRAHAGALLLTGAPAAGGRGGREQQAGGGGGPGGAHPPGPSSSAWLGREGREHLANSPSVLVRIPLCRGMPSSRCCCFGT